MKYFYVIAAAIMIVGGLAGIDDWPKTGTLAVVFGLMCLAQGIKTARGPQKRKALPLGETEPERAAMLQENYDKALDDYNAIEAARRATGDVELSQHLGRMQQISGNMIKYLGKNPDKLTAADKFIGYYQDRAAVLAEKFVELEETGLDTPDVNKMKARIKTTLGEIDSAYVREFESLLSDRLIDMDAELKVMRQTLTADGATAKSDARINVTAQSEPDFLAKKNLAVKNDFSIIPPAQRQDVMITKGIQSALAIFLGGFGAHKFYQGKTFQGVLYILFCWSIIPGVIGFCEGIRYLFMKMDDFYLEYYLDK